MVVTREIGTYKVLLLDWQTGTDGGHAGFVYLYAPLGDYLGYVCGIRAGAPFPEDAVQENGVLHIHVPEAQMTAMIGMLRSERFVRLSYDATARRGAVERALLPVDMPEAHVAAERSQAQITA